LADALLASRAICSGLSAIRNPLSAVSFLPLAFGSLIARRLCSPFSTEGFCHGLLRYVHE
jgi:hypothetical protein